MATEAPTAIGSSATVPDLCAVISFSIFIASITHTSAPSSTVGAGLDGNLEHGALDRRGQRVAPAAAAAGARRCAPARGVRAPARPGGRCTPR